MKHLGFLLLFLALAGIGITAYRTDSQGFLLFSTPLAKVFTILALILIANIITTLGVWLLKKYTKTKEKAEIKQVTSVFRYLVFIILVLVIFVMLYGVIGPVITSIGLFAAGLTLALQRPILNIAGWFSIVAKRPYRIGDRVDIGSISGFVHEISLMHTHLSLVDKEESTGRVVFVPNEQALTLPIVNYTRGSALVWDYVKVKVPASADIANIEKRLVKCANAVVGKEMKMATEKWKVEVKPETRTSLEYRDVEHPFLEISVRYLCNAKNLTVVKSDITKKIISEFSAELGAKNAKK
ncbi:mechanosensitive ion channel [Candidatus Woesearchaeota archaeon]|nr:mechanosensitive ion channel [Candidatus Woesearchaeota archaeon]